MRFGRLGWKRGLAGGASVVDAGAFRVKGGAGLVLGLRIEKGRERLTENKLSEEKMMATSKSWDVEVYVTNAKVAARTREGNQQTVSKMKDLICR